MTFDLDAASSTTCQVSNVLFPDGLRWRPVRLPTGLELCELGLPCIPAPKCRCEYLAAQAFRDRCVTFELLTHLANLAKCQAACNCLGRWHRCTVWGNGDLLWWCPWGGASWLACVNANISLVHTATFHFHSELHLWSAS